MFWNLFRTEYLDKELSVTWINKFSKAKKDYSGRMKIREEILRHQKRLKNLVKELGLTIKELRAINRKYPWEAKARRAKKDMVEANLRLVISSPRNIPINVCRLNSGREHRR